MKLIFSHPTGNANVRAAGKGFAEANLLIEFHVSLASFTGGVLDWLGAFGPLSEIRRRRFDPVLRSVTKTWPWREVGRLTASRLRFAPLIKHETGLFSIDAVYRDLDQRVSATLKAAAIKGARGVYAYEDGAAFSFSEAKKLGLHCFYDLPTGYWRTARQLLQGERERWPEWASTITGLEDSIAKLSRKDEELRLADQIFVASQFTANTLKAYPGELAPIEVIPYGFPSVGLKREYGVRLSHQRLKLLFVGKLSQQKGVADLFAALEGLSDRVELTLVGHKAKADCSALNKALTKHRWIPTLSHDEVLKLMREHDVLLFPSLFDGFGLVITEAMSQGTPVIASERSAGPDLIQHDVNGWLVEAGSSFAIRYTIEKLLSRPDTIARVGKEAMDTARKRPWTVYSQELTEAVKKHLVH